jgi:hypothetical protein
LANLSGLLISEASLGFDREGVYRQLAGTTHATFVVYRVSGAGHNSITDLVLTTPESFKYEMSRSREPFRRSRANTVPSRTVLRFKKCR